MLFSALIVAAIWVVLWVGVCVYCAFCRCDYCHKVYRRGHSTSRYPRVFCSAECSMNDTKMLLGHLPDTDLVRRLARRVEGLSDEVPTATERRG